MAESLNRTKDIFLKALDFSSPDERAAFLAQACGSDAPLRRQVEAMLQAHASPDGFLEIPAAAMGPTIDEPPRLPDEAAETPGTRVGRYKLLQQVGEGGMGTVWMAEQMEPVRRKVALKLIKPGMDSAQVIARFEAERQALALMDHPNIAKVLDAGTIGSEPEASARVEATPLANASGSEKPYFVMELVKGIAITKYCDDNQLTPRERLALMIPVCQAVQHAHQKGVIHRDLKPSNVLIACYDGKPVPKVIDFGVAKAMGQQLTERTLFTGFGGIVGTLEYMSPEQAEFNALDVDTRSDIYSLGVLLYELLTGSPPLSRQRLKEAGLAEVLRLIREEEPPKPSTRLSESKDTLKSLSAQRKLEPAQLTKEVRGELDWIVMKALDKDRNRRYETANGLARDIERYLTDQLVEACPPSRWYLLRKFTRRNKRLLVSVAMFMVLLIAGTTISIWQAVRADQAAVRAGQAEQRAQLDRDASEAAFSFLHDLIFTPVKAGEPDLRKALDRAAPRIDARFGQQPFAELRVRMIVGEAYHWLKDDEQAEPHSVRAREICLRELGPDHRSTLIASLQLARVYQGLGKLDLAEPLARNGLDRARRHLGEDDFTTHQYRHMLGKVLYARGRLDEAEAMLTAAIEGFGRIPGPAFLAWELATTRHGLATIYADQKRWHEAELLLRNVEQQYREELGPEDAGVAAVQTDLGWALLDQKKYAEAEGILRECLPILEKKRPGQWTHFNTQSLLGEALAGQRKFADAEQHLLAAEKELLKFVKTDKKEKAHHAKWLRAFRERLVSLYEAWERPKDAAQWRTKLQKLAAPPTP